MTAGPIKVEHNFFDMREIFFSIKLQAMRRDTPLNEIEMKKSELFLCDKAHKLLT